MKKNTKWNQIKTEDHNMYQYFYIIKLQNEWKYFSRIWRAAKSNSWGYFAILLEKQHQWKTRILQVIFNEFDIIIYSINPWIMSLWQAIKCWIWCGILNNFCRCFSSATKFSGMLISSVSYWLSQPVSTGLSARN